MKKLADFIVQKRKLIFIIMLIITVISGCFAPFVSVNYDMSKYLPDSSPMKQGVDLMAEEFPTLTNESSIRVMFKDLPDSETTTVYNRLAAIDNVKNVEYEADNEDYNKDGYKLFTVYTDYDYSASEEHKIEKEVKHIISDYDDAIMHNDNVGNGELPFWVVAIALTILLIILLAMCGSWFEPVLLLATIGIAVVINLGTNIFQGEISNCTFMIEALLQLVLSMDYSIILINRYRQKKLKIDDNEEAMKQACVEAFPSIFSSGLTTVVGLLMLVFMSFKIGIDLGVPLAKGVLLSMICVCTVMPYLILKFSDLIFRTTKKQLDVPMGRFANFTSKFHKPMALLFVLLFIGAYLGESLTNITYTLEMEDKIADVFPQENQIVVLYNNDDESGIAAIADEISAQNGVTSVLSYPTTLNKKMDVDELSDTIASMGSDANIDSSLLKIVYYSKFGGKNYTPMTVSELINFIQDDVMNNPQFASYISDDMKSSMDSMSTYADPYALTVPKSSSELADMFGIDKSQVDLLLMYYQAKNGGIKMTLSEFTDFIINDIATNPTYSSEFTEDQLSQMSSLEALTDTSNLTTKKTYTEVASLLGQDSDTIGMMYAMYRVSKGEIASATMTVPEFTAFLNENISSSAFSSYIDDDTAEQIQTLNTITQLASVGNNLTAGILGSALQISEKAANVILGNIDENMSIDSAIDSAINSSDLDDNDTSSLKTAVSLIKASAQGKTYTPAEMSKLLGMDESMIALMYSYKDIKNSPSSYKYSLEEVVNGISGNSELISMMGSDQASQITSMQMLVNGSVNNTAFTCDELASITGMEPSQIAMLYMLYATETGENYTGYVSVKDFVDFIASDVITNDTFSSQIDPSMASQLTSAKELIDAVVDGKTYSSSEMYTLLSSLTDELDSDMIDLLYLYHSAMNSTDSSWKMSLLEMFDYVTTDMLNDETFSAFIDDDTRTLLTESQDTISSSVDQMKGPNYSMMVINTTLPHESDETHSFMTKLESLLDNNTSGDYYLIGTSAMNEEMADSFHSELTRLTILTALSIFLIVLFSFKNLIIPIILVSIVQCGVFITVTVSGLLGYDIYYLSLLIVQCILMGATIDYGILYTNYYRDFRLRNNIRDSLKKSYRGATHTILTSGLILILVTGVIGFTPNVDPTISQVCQTISIGALSATLLIMFVLPSLLAAFDKLVVSKKYREKHQADNSDTDIAV